MFRMVPGIDVGRAIDGASGRPPSGAIAGSVAVARGVRSSACWPPSPQPRDVRPGETEMAQRSAAVVAATYRAEVDIDRRDRMLLVSYDAAAMNADRFAWAVCDTIRTVPDCRGSARYCATGRSWRCRRTACPGSCRIGE